MAKKVKVDNTNQKNQVQKHAKARQIENLDTVPDSIGSMYFPKVWSRTTGILCLCIAEI